jgi:hypothetical protein
MANDGNCQTKNKLLLAAYVYRFIYAKYIQNGVSFRIIIFYKQLPQLKFGHWSADIHKGCPMGDNWKRLLRGKHE